VHKVPPPLKLAEDLLLKKSIGIYEELRKRYPTLSIQIPKSSFQWDTFLFLNWCAMKCLAGAVPKIPGADLPLSPLTGGQEFNSLLQCVIIKRSVMQGGKIKEIPPYGDWGGWKTLPPLIGLWGL